jgi:hypothetical protein
MTNSGRPSRQRALQMIDAILLADGTAINGTGLTIALVLKDRGGNCIDKSGKVSWLDAAAGKVRYRPVLTDLLAKASPHSARWVVSLLGQDSYYPNKAPEQWIVRAQ